MEETLISFKTAELAKDKGFNILCKFSYDSDGGLQTNEPLNKEDKCFLNKCDVCYSAPTQGLLQKWLREVHGINIVVAPSHECFNILFISEYDKIEDQNEYAVLNGLEFKDFKTYEGALEVGLFEALKLVK